MVGVTGHLYDWRYGGDFVVVANDILVVVLMWFWLALWQFFGRALGLIFQRFVRLMPTVSKENLWL